jgi:hypothetical protein
MYETDLKSFIRSQLKATSLLNLALKKSEPVEAEKEEKEEVLALAGLDGMACRIITPCIPLCICICHFE